MQDDRLSRVFQKSLDERFALIDQGKRPARVYVSPLIAALAKVEMSERDAFFALPGRLIGYAGGLDWYVDQALSGENIRIECD